MRTPTFRPFAALLLVVLFGALGAAACAEEGPPLLEAPASLRLGDPLFATLSSTSPLEALTLELRGTAGRLLAKGPVFLVASGPPRYAYEGLAGVPWDAPAGPAELRIAGRAGGKAFTLSRSLAIESRVFAAETIPLSADNTALRTEPDPRKTLEAKRMQELLGLVDPAGLHFDGAFVPPVGPARRSAGFGDRRIYRYSTGASDTSWHAGIDFAVPTGTLVLAPAAGKVVLAEYRLVTGWTMVLEHLPGLYSVYMHLSRVLSPLDSLVARGQVLAWSGATGLATGPHLHWELRAASLPVDPDWFLSPPAAAWLSLPPGPPIDTGAPARASSGDFEGR